MTVIGIISAEDTKKIEKILRKLFLSRGIRAVTVDGGRITEEQLSGLSNAGVKCCIVTLNQSDIHPFYLDILILADSRVISFNLIKCISSTTRVIYNADGRKLPFFDHPNAISYGMSYDAEATISSVDDKCEDISFVFCLQRPLTSLSGKLLYAGETSVVLSGMKAGVSEALAAVTCGLLCDLPLFQTVKI